MLCVPGEDEALVGVSRTKKVTGTTYIRMYVCRYVCTYVRTQFMIDRF